MLAAIAPGHYKKVSKIKENYVLGKWAEVGRGSDFLCFVQGSERGNAA
jgi:hypothetical protein